jgi:hypothetical protein
MTRADRVLSTPPTNASALPVDPTRRRFLTVAAVGSMVSAGTLAAAALTPNDVPQAVTMPAPSPELRAAIRQLMEAHTNLITAQANNEEAEAIRNDWETQNPSPASRKGRRRWLRRSSVHRESIVAAPWQALMTAETAFVEAQDAVASVPVSGVANVHALAAACSVVYDRVELARHNRAPIARVVAQELCRYGKAVLS